MHDILIQMYHKSAKKKLKEEEKRLFRKQTRMCINEHTDKRQLKEAGKTDLPLNFPQHSIFNFLVGE